MTENTRMRELLRLAGKQFEEASSPFVSEWLSENDVTATECCDLSFLIANAITVYLALPNDERMALLVKTALDELSLTPQQKKDILAHMDLVRVSAKLKKATERESA